jgi:hypothetical protein
VWRSETSGAKEGTTGPGGEEEKPGNGAPNTEESERKSRKERKAKELAMVERWMWMDGSGEEVERSRWNGQSGRPASTSVATHDWPQSNRHTLPSQQIYTSYAYAITCF